MVANKEFNIYLAGPEVFLPDPVVEGANKRAVIARFNREVLAAKNFRFVGHYPLDTKIDGYANNPRTAMQIFHGCVEMMDNSDLIIANITHFRGPSADVGTAFEVGYMHAQRKPIFIYYNVQETYCTKECDNSTPDHNAQTIYRDKVRAFASGHFVNRSPTEDRDNDNFLIEDFGLIDNLMLIGVARAGLDETDSYAPAGSFWEALQEAADSLTSFAL